MSREIEGSWTAREVKAAERRKAQVAATATAAGRILFSGSPLY
jgi:hypothetical protein